MWSTREAMVLTLELEIRNTILPIAVIRTSVHYLLVDTSEKRLREFGRGLKFGGHVPGEEFLDPAERVVGDAAQHLAQPAFGINTVEACRSEQGVDGSCAVTAAV